MTPTSEAEALIKVRKPHDGQREVLRGMGSHRFCVVMCGRRWGKTELGIRESIKRAARGEAVAWYAPSYKLVDEVWAKVSRALEPITQARNATTKRLETVGGGVFEIWALDRGVPPRGRAYHYVIVDEAAHAKALLDLWRNVIRAQLADHKGGALFISTPWGHNDFHTLYLRGQTDDPQWISFRQPTHSNPYIDPDEIAQMIEDIGVEWVVKQEVYAEPSDDGTNPYGTHAVIDRQTVDPTGEDVVVWGMDVGRFVDATALVGLDHMCKPAVVHRWVGVGWPQQIDEIAEIIGDDPCIMDATGAGRPVYEILAERCGGIEPFTYTQQSKQALFEAHIYAVSQGEAWFSSGEMNRQAKIFTYDYKPGRGVKYSHPEGDHDDDLHAAALGHRLAVDLGYPQPRGFETRAHLVHRQSARSRLSRVL